MGFAISAENHKGFTCCDQPRKYRRASSASNKSKGKFSYQTLIHLEMACFPFGVSDLGLEQQLELRVLLAIAEDPGYTTSTQSCYSNSR